MPRRPWAVQTRFARTRQAPWPKIKWQWWAFLPWMLNKISPRIIRSKNYCNNVCYSIAVLTLRLKTARLLLKVMWLSVEWSTTCLSTMYQSKRHLKGARKRNWLSGRFHSPHQGSVQLAQSRKMMAFASSAREHQKSWLNSANNTSMNKVRKRILTMKWRRRSLRML